jgi:prophage regulatory protein
MIHTERGTTPLGMDGLSDNALVRLEHLHSLKIVPFSSSTVWRKVRNGEFPAPIKISAGVTAWRMGDLRAWLSAPGDFRGSSLKTGEAR